MTRDEATETQYLQGLGKHDGAVIWRGNSFYLMNLNYPQHKPQMAKIRDAEGNAPAGTIKGGWVPLDELEMVPF
jgi:hypothetical protein